MKSLIKGNAGLADVIDAISDPLRVIDADRNIILINKAMEERFGHVVGKKCFDLLGRGEPCRGCICKDVLEGKGHSANGERTICGRNYSVTSSLFSDDDGRPLGAVEVFRDVTEYVSLCTRLEDYKSSMRRDLNVARAMQRSMLGRVSGSPEGYEIETGFFPCAEVGGDAYDIIAPEPGKLLMYIADVSGHGIMSAMITVFIKREMAAQCERHGDDLRAVLKGLFAAFREMGAADYIYFTIFAVLLDIESGSLSCINMGHSVCPILRLADGTLTELCAPGDPVCCWVEDPSMGHVTARLEKGGRLLLYTDGVEDAAVLAEFGASAKACKQLFMNSRLKNNVDDQLIMICDRLTDQ